jgi:hypothetical protein
MNEILGKSSFEFEAIDAAARFWTQGLITALSSVLHY